MKLDLDWNLETTEERVQFVQKYTEQHASSLTDSNLETISEYILWSISEPDFELTSSKSPWNKVSKEVSLDELKEKAAETGRPVDSLVTEVQYTKKATKLDREQVASKLAKGATYEQIMLYELHPELQLHAMTPQWVEVWSLIDTTEYMVQYWELRNGKRRPDLPIRDELISRLNIISHRRKLHVDELLEELQEKSNRWSSKDFLRNKRLLVTYRQSQYQLLDALQGEMSQPQGNVANYYEDKHGPLNSFYPYMDPKLLIQEVNDSHFEPAFQETLLNQLRITDNFEFNINNISLTEPQTIRTLLQMEDELETSMMQLPLLDKEIVELLLRFFRYYVAKAELTPELELIKNMKVEGIKNKEIALAIHEKFGILYKENYISTIYTKRIIEAIVEAAKTHQRLMEYISMGKSVFKTCSRCGQLLPRNAEYFNKRSSTSDGFFPYCKRCRN